MSDNEGYSGIWISTPPRWFWKPRNLWERATFPIRRKANFLWARITGRVKYAKYHSIVVSSAEPVEFPK